MGPIEHYVAALDDAWEHAWESLSAALSDVDDMQASWQARCYADVEREDAWPSPGTIAWQVAHVTHCKRYYTEIIRHRGASKRPPVPPYEPTVDFAAARLALTAAHQTQRATVAALEPADLDLRASNDMSLPEFLRMMIRHDTWHASQIAIARRLWQTRDEGE